MTYSLWGYSPFYSKNSNWVLIKEYETMEEVIKAKAHRESRLGGRQLGGFDLYKITPPVEKEQV